MLNESVYTLISELIKVLISLNALGGFGVVFRVRDQLSGEQYALKRSYVNDEKDLSAFKREIQIIVSFSP